MPKIYKRHCEICGKYYEGRGQFTCSKRCGVALATKHGKKYVFPRGHGRIGGRRPVIHEPTFLKIKGKIYSAVAADGTGLQTDLLYDYKGPYQPVVQGIGFLGALGYDPIKDRVQCHICGKWFKHLGTHVKSHDLTPRQYKLRFGLVQETALISESCRLGYVQRLKKRLNSGSINLKLMAQKAAEVRKKNSELGFRGTVEARNHKNTCILQLKARYQHLAELLKQIPSKKEAEAVGIYPKRAGFSSFDEFVEFCEFDPSLPRGNHKYSRAILSDVLKRFVTHHNRLPTTSDCRRGLLPPVSAFFYHFGSWAQAREFALQEIIWQNGSSLIY